MAETTAPKTGDRRRLAVVIAAGLSAIALLVWMTTQQTTAGFTATTQNAGNLLQTGSLTITGNPASGQVLLTASDLLPGDSVNGSITVTNGSDAPLRLKIFSADLVESPSAAGGIAENLNVTITKDADTTPFYTGTVADLATLTDFAGGVSGTAGGDPLDKTSNAAGVHSVTYAFTVTLDAGAGRPSQNVNPADSATIEITFEGRA